MKKKNNRIPKEGKWLYLIIGVCVVAILFEVRYLARKDKVEPKVEQYKKTLPGYEEAKQQYEDYMKQAEQYRDSLWHNKRK